MRGGQHKSFAGMQREMLLDIWANLCREAQQMNRPDLIEKYAFPEGAGYRRIDMSTAPFSREMERLKRCEE